MLVSKKEKESEHMPKVTVIQPTLAEKQTTKLRCAAYCRVSSDSTDQLNSFYAQTRYYSQLFEDSETEQLVDLYADEGITGTREDKRDEFQRMMKDCRKGKIDRIYTKSISRFSRNTRDCLKSIRELKELGVTIYFEKENIDTADITDEVMITIMGGLAQEESTSISNNLKWGYRTRFQKGTVNAFSAPFGYKLCKGALVIDEPQAIIVREIFNMFLSGIGYQRIADICQQQYSQYKDIFSYYGIRWILTNERYIGDSLYQKSFTTDTLPYKKLQNKGELDKYYISDTHSAIISKDVFEQVQALIESRKHASLYSEHVFSRKITCANCGTKYKRKRYGKKIFWVCRKHDNLAASCSSIRIPEGSIQSAFIKLCNKLLHNYKQILIPLQTSLQDLKVKNLSSKTQLMDIHKEIANLKEQTYVLARLKTKGFMDEEKYRMQTAEITSKISKLKKEMNKLTRSDDEDETLEQIDMLIDFFERREVSFKEFDESAFESIVEKIVVSNNRELNFHILGGLVLKETI